VVVVTIFLFTPDLVLSSKIHNYAFTIFETYIKEFEAPTQPNIQALK
jgi:hypothetical protein